MSKKYNKDDGLKQLVEEQFIKEAEMMEKALFSDEDFEDYEMTDQEVEASYQDFLRRLEEEKEEIPPKTEKIIPMSRKLKGRIPVAKVAGITALCVISIFAASMTGEANRRYVINSVRYLMGDDTRIVVDNDEENELPETDEYEAIADIEETLGVEVPEFMYRPEGFEFIKYEVDRYSQTARIEYNFKNTILLFYIDKESVNSSSKIDSLHGSDEDFINIKNENISAVLKEVKDSKDTVPNYYVQWEKDQIRYQLSGKIEKKILKKIVENIKY